VHFELRVIALLINYMYYNYLTFWQLLNVLRNWFFTFCLPFCAKRSMMKYIDDYGGDELHVEGFIFARFNSPIGLFCTVCEL